ncbi:MAG: SGNH/GDSL hydrolase family protein, partial [Chloroflexota bacterium]
PMLFGPPEAQSYLVRFDTEWLVIYSLVVLWGIFGLLTLFPPLRAGLRRLRAHPVIYAYLVALVFVICVLMGLVLLQPMQIHPFPKFSLYWIGVCLWSVVFLLGYNMSDEQLRAIGRGLTGAKWEVGHAVKDNTAKPFVTVSADGVLLTLLTLFVMFMGVEFWLRYSVVQTSGFSLGNANHQWNTRYWQMNDLGFRDPLPQETDNRVVIVLGDSVAAGQGIPYEEQRFGNQLGALLGDGYDVYTVAERGWNAQTQLGRLQEFPLTPDIVVYSYVLNDITEAFEDVTGSRDEGELFRRESGPLRAVTKRLFILDYLHLNYGPAYVSYRNDYADVTSLMYQNEEVWDVHTDEIHAIVDWSREQGADVVAVAWAEIQGNSLYDAPYARVLDVLAAKDVPTLDTRAIIEAVPMWERFAFVSDQHPGVVLQEPVAEGLHALLLENNIVAE